MKKAAIGLVVFLMLIQFVIPAFATTSILEVPNVKVIINGTRTRFTSAPLVVSNRTMLPYGEFLANLGVPVDAGHVCWDDADQTLTLRVNAETIVMKVDSVTAKINDRDMTLDVAPIIYKGNVYVPARFISEALGKRVVWDGSTVAVFIIDANDYGFIKSTISKANNAMQGIYTLKTQTDTKVDFSGNADGAAFNVDMRAKGSSLYDAQSNMNYTQMDTYLADDEIKTEEYYKDNCKYTRNVLENTWEKKELPGSQFDSYVKACTNAILTASAGDAFCAGLQVNKSLTTGSTLVLSGNSFSDILFNQAETKSYAIPKDSIINDFSIDIYIDKTTNYITKVDFSFSGTDISNGTPLDYSANMNMIYSDFNTPVEISLPSGI